jgi:hypothetical protein
VLQVDVDFAQLEDQFAAKPTHAPAVAHGIKQPRQAAARAILDLDRARNVGVFARGLKMTAAAASTAVDTDLAALSDRLGSGLGKTPIGSGAADDCAAGLSEDAVQGLLAIFPTSAEATQLTAQRCVFSAPICT